MRETLNQKTGVNLAVLVALVFTSVFGAGTSAQAENGEHSPIVFKGRVQQKPLTGNIGLWEVGARWFVTDNQTEVQGALEIGSCAAVRFVELGELKLEIGRGHV